MSRALLAAHGYGYCVAPHRDIHSFHPYFGARKYLKSSELMGAALRWRVVPDEESPRRCWQQRSSVDTAKTQQPAATTRGALSGYTPTAEVDQPAQAQVDPGTSTAAKGSGRRLSACLDQPAAHSSKGHSLHTHRHRHRHTHIGGISRARAASCPANNSSRESALSLSNAERRSTATTTAVARKCSAP